MRRYRFIVFDEHKLLVDSRDFPAANDEPAIAVADGWRDVRGGHLVFTPHASFSARIRV